MSTHTCHWPGCSASVPPAMWGCRSHWFRLPKELRDLIWSTYKPGQEVSKDPSLEYVAAAEMVQDWIRAHCAAEIGVPMIHTLSILQPWAWLIVHGHKDVENREWATSFRGRFLVHAGKRFGREQREDAAQVIERFPGIKLPEDFALGGIVGEAELVDCTDQHPSPWFVGRFGLVLANAKPLPFRAYTGQLGFFRTPDVKPC